MPAVPIWPSHNLENMAIRLHVARGREHRALPDARLVQDVLLELLHRTPTVKSIANLVHMSPPLTCADAPTASNPTRGFCWGSAPHAPPVQSTRVSPMTFSDCLAARDTGLGAIYF